ncbi:MULTISPECIES: BTAD domain-containing putative transcriptional regulator [unclassified Streptomyces]|uniref:AfsR/SARP family transcriptional regulator n=1 Tax=unclassified Streptomyces TaxID=2593676 RepID=UPI0036EF81E7
MHFTLLGPVRAWRGDAEVEVGHAKVRAVLACLLLRRGGRATTGQLIDDLWGIDAPASAEALVRTYVHKLRKGLGSPFAERIRSQDGGYVLDTDAVPVDLTTFEERVADARALRDQGDPVAAAALYRDGIALWNGPPLAGVPGPYAETQRARLEGRLLRAAEEWLACLVDAGQYAEAASELVLLIADHPLVERLRELHMLALYGGGRQADALAVFARTSRLLRDELGVEPTPALQETHRRILSGDLLLGRRPPAPGPGPAPTAERAAPWFTPAQLPASLPRFTGRQDQCEQVAALARETAAHDTTTTCVIHGMPGVGKTTFATQVAHRVKSRFPGGQLYVNLHGVDNVAALEPHDVLADFLSSLGVASSQLPASTEARAALYRSVVADRRILLLLDNARDIDQVRPLLPGSPGCLILVTSRSQIPGLTVAHQAREIHLGPFDDNEARAYLAGALGSRRVAAQPEAAGEIIDFCAGLPLALALATARTAHLPTTSLTQISEPLRDVYDGLDALALGKDPSENARVVFSWSYDSLTPENARLFRLLSLHPGPEITPKAAAVLARVPVSRAEVLLDDLNRVNLLGESTPGRYICHDLLRTYADELSRARDSAAERERAVERLLAYYVFSADAANSLITSSIRRQIVAVATHVPTVAPEQFADECEAVSWLEAELSVLIATVKWAADQGAGDEAWRLSWYLNALPRK